MLEFQSGDHVFYLNHLISFIASFGFMYYICYKIARGEIDKFLHSVVSSVITFIILHICYFASLPWFIAPLTSMFVGFSKEFADRFNPKKKIFDWEDIYADLIGTGAVTIVYVISFLL